MTGTCTGWYNGLAQKRSGVVQFLSRRHLISGPEQFHRNLPVNNPAARLGSEAAAQRLESRLTRPESVANPLTQPPQIDPRTGDFPRTGERSPPEAPDLGLGTVLFDRENAKPPEAKEEERLVMVKEAAEALGITVRAVRRIVAKRHIKTEKRPLLIEVQALYVSLDDLLEYRRMYSKFDPKPKKRTKK